MELKTFVEIGDYEIEVTVDFDYYPPSRGYRDSLGVPEEPDEPESLAINSITTTDGAELLDQLPYYEIRVLEDECWMHLRGE